MTNHDELNATAASLLGFLHEKPMTGFELANKAAAVTGEFWNVTRSQIYRELKVLAAAGLVVMRETGPRDKQPYALTRAGRAAFAQWISEPPGALTMRFPIVLSVFFGAHLPPVRLRAFLDEHRAHHARRLAECRSLEPVVERIDHVRDALRLGVLFHETVVRWIDTIVTSGADVPVRRPRAKKRKGEK
jgi:DNA-binding PadR family transcriptional regulator